MFDINPYYVFTILVIASGSIPKGNRIPNLCHYIH
jgi:hypothetical protein